MLSLDEDWGHRDDPDVWRRPILVTIARDGEGIAEVVEAFEEHREFLDRTGTREAVEARRFESIIEEMLGDHIILRLREVVPREEFESLVADVAARRLDKSEAVDRLLERIMGAS
jgi:LAO/AO transport system kinase